jgi:hypothetical protein
VEEEHCPRASFLRNNSLYFTLRAIFQMFKIVPYNFIWFFLAAAKRVTGSKGFESKTGKDASKRNACVCGKANKSRYF